MCVCALPTLQSAGPLLLTPPPPTPSPCHNWRIFVNKCQLSQMLLLLVVFLFVWLGFFWGEGGCISLTPRKGKHTLFNFIIVCVYKVLSFYFLPFLQRKGNSVSNKQSRICICIFDLFSLSHLLQISCAVQTKNQKKEIDKNK